MKNLLTIALLAVATLTLSAQDLPTQDGFTWWKIPDLKGAILVPDGWHTKESAKGSTKGYFVSASEITEANPAFDVGLTLNVLKNFKTTKGKDPLVWARLYRESAKKKGKILDSWDKDMGPFKSLGFRLKTKDAKGSLIMHQLFVINPKTGTLYFYIFEAPEDQWNTAWLSGEKMMKLLLIDDEI